MLAKIRAFFTEELAHEANEKLTGEQLHLAAAALLIEVATADDDYDGAELAAMGKVLEAKFGLERRRIDELTDLAHAEQESATSLYQFTQLINQHSSPEEKFELLHGMWQIAYADGRLDKYEEHLIRKVADLIYVPHSDFIRAKLMARDGANESDSS